MGHLYKDFCILNDVFLSFQKRKFIHQIREKKKWNQTNQIFIEDKLPFVETAETVDFEAIQTTDVLQRETRVY